MQLDSQLARRHTRLVVVEILSNFLFVDTHLADTRPVKRAGSRGKLEFRVFRTPRWTRTAIQRAVEAVTVHYTRDASFG